MKGCQERMQYKLHHSKKHSHISYLGPSSRKMTPLSSYSYREQAAAAWPFTIWFFSTGFYLVKNTSTKILFYQVNCKVIQVMKIYLFIYLFFWKWSAFWSKRMWTNCWLNANSFIFFFPDRNWTLFLREEKQFIQQPRHWNHLQEFTFTSHCPRHKAIENLPALWSTYTMHFTQDLGEQHFFAWSCAEIHGRG